MSKFPAAALPIAWITLRILIVVNWVYGAAILGLVAFTFVNEPWFMKAIHVPTETDPRSIMIGLRTIALLGVAAVPLTYAMLKRLLAIVETVRQGAPFVADNAYRLQAIGWILLALQLLSMVIGSIGHSISSKQFPLHLDAGFSVNGWLCVIFAFILARVFAEGTLMREDLEGTV